MDATHLDPGERRAVLVGAGHEVGRAEVVLAQVLVVVLLRDAPHGQQIVDARIIIAYIESQGPVRA